MLLLEAGRREQRDAAITTPGRWVSLIGSPFDWGYATEPEPGLGRPPPHVSARQGRRRIERDQRDDLHPRPSPRLRRLAARGQRGLGLRRCAAGLSTDRGQLARRIASIAARADRCGSRTASIRMRATKRFWPRRGALGYQADPRWDFSEPQPEERRRLLPEEHQGRPAPQRGRGVPASGAGASEPRRSSPARRRRRLVVEKARASPASSTCATATRAGARGARGDPVRRRHRLAEAADAVGHRAGRSSPRDRHSGRRRPAGRRRRTCRIT